MVSESAIRIVITAAAVDLVNGYPRHHHYRDGMDHVRPPVKPGAVVIAKDHVTA